jgi:predicted ATPase
LRAVIDWSYDLLSEKEKVLLSRLSLFAGGWTLDAATAICAEVPAEEPGIVDLLSNLADKSLVIMEEGAGTTRYRFLETIRQYALDRLSESGEADKLRGRFVEYYIHLAAEAEGKFRGADQLHWLKIMEMDRDNMRAAFQYGLEMSQIEPARHLVGAAFWLWFFRGPWSEGQVWAEAVLARSPRDHTPSRARVLMALGLFQFVQSNYSVASAAFDDSIALWREVGDPWWCAFVLAFRGLIMRTKDRQSADALFSESLAFAKQAGEKWIVAFALWNIGENELYAKNLPQARRILQESLELSQAIGDQLLQIEVLRVLGGTAEAEGDYPGAMRLYGESLAIIERFGDTTNISVLHYDLGRAAQLAGDNDTAVHQFTESIHWSVRLGKKPGILRAIAGLGVVAAARGQARRAVALLAASHSRLAELGTNFIFNAQNPQSIWLNGYLAAMHSQLDEEAFRAASAEGQAMTLEQLVELALRVD